MPVLPEAPTGPGTEKRWDRPRASSTARSPEGPGAPRPDHRPRPAPRGRAPPSRLRFQPAAFGRCTAVLGRESCERRRLEAPTCRRAKRALKLDGVKKYKPSEATPLTKKKNLNSYSPTTGTCRLSPFSSPTSHNAQGFRNGLSNDLPGDGTKQNNLESRLSRRGQPQAEKDEFAELQSKVKSSLVRFLKMRASLTSLQALEGSRELENIIGVSDSSCSLRAEVQKTQVLMDQAEELQLLEKKHGKLPAQDP
ncbi:centromere protein R isoform X2 [Oxyura jamaicensis]|uniref:centromere protein R isoform X2 n=1 Tax=Oxyura jamaicensis TaxID=8884 RepID=UPI0015A6C1A8|nr:centromere protein R isoform X2 [Oxyura jamaicensis]